MSSGHDHAAARDAWRARAARALDADPRVAGWGLVGSFGRGEADEWSDLDLLVVVDDAAFAAYSDPDRNELWSAADVFTDARRNAPAAATSVGTLYVESGLPVGVDWYVYPRTLAAWPTDCAVQNDGAGIPRSAEGFAEWNGRGARGTSLPISEVTRRRARLTMVPIAAKYVARRSEQAAPMVTFLDPEARVTEPAEMLAALSELVDRLAASCPDHVVAAVRAHLALAAASIGQHPSG